MSWFSARDDGEELPPLAGCGKPIAIAHVFSRPSGIRVYDRMLHIATDSDDLWIGTRGCAVAHMRA